MKTNYEKNSDWQDKKLLKIIDPYCFDFKDVGGLMRNCLTQHDIIHALLSILKDRFNCTVEANQRYIGGEERKYIFESLTYSVNIPREETNVYMIKDYEDTLNLVKSEKDK
jgi:hypothetical protein